MALEQYCIPENLSWCGTYAKGYTAQVSETERHTVICYRIPFPAEEEPLFLARHGIAASERVGVYQNLVKCIQQNIKATQLLTNAGIPSILRYLKVEQVKDKQGVSYILLETEEIRPIREVMLRDSISQRDALNVVARLTIVLRDIAKDPVSMVIRAMDINEIYINTENRILVGCFHYAAAKELPEPPPFLPGHPRNLRSDICKGELGDPGADMYTLACLAWNLYSGLPLESQLPDNIKIYPQYAVPLLAEVLLMGRSGKAEDVAAFRKGISDCRRQYGKQLEQEGSFKIREQIRKDYVYEWK